MDSIRARIETSRTANLRAHRTRQAWEAGNLIPADEVQARIDSAVSEAVREERERCAKIVEEMPDTHRMDLSFGDFGRLDKIVSAIRKEPDHD